MYEIFAKLLEERGITPYRVSVDTGVSQGSLSDWKRGKSKPKYEKLKAIAEYFDVTVDFLLGVEEQNNNELDNKKSPSTNGEALSHDPLTVQILETLDKLTPENRLLALDFLKVLASRDKK